MSGWGGAAPGLEQRLLARFRGTGMGTARPLVVAFSGGPDSLALAAALTHVRAVAGLPLLLVHVDHRLRDSSAAEARRAEELAEALAIEVEVRQVPAHPQELHPGVGLEEAARRERYRLLHEAAQEIDAVAVATGHHREDQAETVLLHLLRGSGLRGASAMAELSVLPIAGPQCDISPGDPNQIVRLWRPFLFEPRAEIQRYVSQRQLTPLFDPSNDDQSLRRNVLRHRVLPEIEAAFPGATASLTRFASLAAEEDAFMESLARKAFAQMRGPKSALQYAELLRAPLALRRRIVRCWLSEETGATELTAERVDAVLTGAASAGVGSRVQLSGGWIVRRAGEWLIVEHGEHAPQQGGVEGWQ